MIAIFTDLTAAQTFSRAIYESRRDTVPNYEPDTLYYSAVEHTPPGNANATGDRWFVPIPAPCLVEIPPSAEMVESLPEGWFPDPEEEEEP